MSKIIGRILSLGFPTPGVLVDNHTIISAPSFFDYDALIVDPGPTSLLVESLIGGLADASSFTGAPVRVRPGATGDVGLLSLLEGRRDETQRLLDNGGTVVVFAHPDRVHMLDGAQWSTYDWLPLPDALRLRPPLLVSAEGSQAHVVDWQHPLAGFVSSQLANIAYRAHFQTERIEGASVFARSYGGAAIGVEIPVERGRLIFLPALKAVPSGDGRYVAADVLQAGIRRSLGVVAPGRAPGWITEHPLPGLAEAARMREDARSTALAATDGLAAAEAAFDGLERFQGLLWQEGVEGLDTVVIDALKRIGLEVLDRDRNELELRVNGVSVLSEVEASERPVDMAPHHRLRQRIERAIERSGSAPRGVLFVNGERLREPNERAHVTDALRVASETMRYCLAPTSGLYAALVAHLEGDEAAVTTYRIGLMTTDGLLSDSAPSVGNDG